ncbi:unknown [Prevotella sp. CAG:924]|nr:unknown [Prevotella sp. CAG:924]
MIGLGHAVNHTLFIINKILKFLSFILIYVGMAPSPVMAFVGLERGWGSV